MRSDMLRGLPVVLAILLALPGSVAGQGRILVVDSTGNSSDSSIGDGVCRTSGGVCTLRAAIQEANATTALDTITFAIGSGPQRITITSNLPTITKPVVIDGWTQPGFALKPLIEVHGTSSLGDGIRISGGDSTLRGLVINGFGGDGVFLSGSTGGNVLEGNYIGTDADGAAPMPNEQTGVRIESPNNRIGGREIAQRNVISGNTGRDILGGVFIYGPSSSGNVVQGNFIGVDATGVYAMGNEGRGVAIHNAPNNVVGGVQPGASNLIAGNRATGVRMWGEADGNYVIGNWIGVNIHREVHVGRWPEPGILSNARGVQMRSDNNVVAYNYIAGNTYDGVLFYDGTGKDFNPLATASNNLVYRNVITQNGRNPPGPDGPGNGIGVFVGTGNRLIANSIYDNFAYGINLAFREWNGIDVNDLLDADEGSNNGQNYPVLTSATTTGGQTAIAGSLHSSPNGTFTLLFYANPTCNWSGYGEGRYPLRGVSVTTDAGGNTNFNVPLGLVLPAGWAVTATAMDAGGNTSEFSACAVVR